MQVPKLQNNYNIISHTRAYVATAPQTLRPREKELTKGPARGKNGYNTAKVPIILNSDGKMIIIPMLNSMEFRSSVFAYL